MCNVAKICLQGICAIFLVAEFLISLALIDKFGAFVNVSELHAHCKLVHFRHKEANR